MGKMLQALHTNPQSETGGRTFWPSRSTVDIAILLYSSSRFAGLLPFALVVLRHAARYIARVSLH